MEAVDKVISEVHHFSKESKFLEGGTKGGGKEVSVLTNSNTLLKEEECVGSRQNHLGEKEEGGLFTCLLGSNGQVVLWSPDIETVLSRFEFSYPCYMLDEASKKSFSLTLDEDGDLEVIRKNYMNRKDGVLLVEQKLENVQEHQSATTLDLVGEQVWRGALFLADFILNNPSVFKDANVLEVASGVGLTSAVAAMVAKKVIVTDVDKGDILDLISRNLDRNKELCVAEKFIREIDFHDLRTIEDLGTLKDDVRILLAADVVYHNQLTDAFFNAVLLLMKEKPNKVLYIALEKRYVFTIEDMDTVAPCYEHFVCGLKWLQSQESRSVTWNIEEVCTSDLPQYFTYERTKDLVLWKIEAVVK